MPTGLRLRWLFGPLAAFSILLVLLASCSQPPPPAPSPGVEKDLPAVILNGDFPDPTILRDGEDYYLTHSSFHAVPGLPIWHSRNLREWKMITRALRTYVGNVWAPEIIKHENLFYIYFPAGGTNWVITANTPAGPWSPPVDLKVGGIDPGHVVSQDGKRYLHLSAGKAVELAPDGLRVLGEPYTVYDGWPYPSEWATECFCLESPKLFFRQGFYHLISAQGGTAGPATSHMAVSARSRSPLGPWENNPHNPFIRTKSAAESWWSKGHATLFADANDQWYAVYHGFQNGQRQRGRQVLLEPVTWTPDGWFHLAEPDGEQFQARVIRNHSISDDDFASPELHLQWQLDGSQFAPEFVLENRTLTLPAQQGKLTVLYAQGSDHDFEISVRLQPTGNVETGLILYFRPQSFVGIGLSGSDGILFLAAEGDQRRKFACPGCAFFKLRLRENTLSMFWSQDGKQWTKHERSLDISALHGNPQAGFNALKPGIFVRGRDRGKGNVGVSDFTYRQVQ
jgi:beta-xylosidase